MCGAWQYFLLQGVPSPNTRSPTEVEVAFNPPSSAGTGNLDQDGPGKTEVGPIASQQSLGGKSQNGLRGASKRSMGSDNPVSWREGRSSIQRKDGARGMVLPFDPLAMTFRHIYYSVDLPAVSSCIECSLYWLIWHIAYSLTASAQSLHHWNLTDLPVLTWSIDSRYLHPSSRAWSVRLSKCQLTRT